MKVLGSWEPVTHDHYYESKKSDRLIGNPEEYAGSRYMGHQELAEYIAAVKSGTADE